MEHFIDRPQGYEKSEKNEKVILVHVTFPHTHADEEIEELQELARSAGLTVAGLVTAKRHAPEAKYFVGSGKAEEIQMWVTHQQAVAVIVNHALSPSQARNLENLCGCRVLDRTDLILDIFAQRAHTYEGRLQVELAQLRHLSTRLVRGWTHLERQKGGIGLRGPGETQLEVDRRLIATRIKHIEQKLEKVELQRDQNRRSRERATVPTVSLVGYTNAGKSTLFNALTEAHVYEADQLFATLDPTLRRLSLPQVGPVVLADTVGFIRKLPHEFVAAFKATLEETKNADLILHVIDVAHPQRGDVIDAVQLVLREIEAETVPQLLVYNKIDLLLDYKPRIERDETGRPYRVWISAVKKQGLGLLQEAIIELLSEGRVYCTVRLGPNEGKIRHRLFELKAIVSEEPLDETDTATLIRLSWQQYQLIFGAIHFAVL